MLKQWEERSVEKVTGRIRPDTRWFVISSRIERKERKRRNNLRAIKLFLSWYICVYTRLLELQNCKVPAKPKPLEIIIDQLYEIIIDHSFFNDLSIKDNRVYILFWIYNSIIFFSHCNLVLNPFLANEIPLLERGLCRNFRAKMEYYAAINSY